ncbi:calcium-dependent protein kinase 7, putative [Plasmodium vivax]|uniref:Calcium-dependent protein kinase 7, putative n=1 Tax=Plasmodium vivax TaxID=5855 RepID=A0A1G4HCU7_PLAVI|nr:calcium-dependent protein kinase 7, putative [Plasmodium vivax]
MGLQTEKDKEKEDQKRNFKICSKKFETDELEVLKKIFKELGSRSASSQIDKETFLQFFPLPGLWGERLFLKFNFKNTGYIDFEEFIIGIAICCRGTKSDKISVLFDIFDLNSDGYIQKSEMVAMLSNIPYIDKLKSVFFNKKNKRKKNFYGGEYNSNENLDDPVEGEDYDDEDDVDSEECIDGENGGDYPGSYHYGDLYGYSNGDQDGDEDDNNYSNSCNDEGYSENEAAEEDNEEDLNDNDEAVCDEGHVSAAGGAANGVATNGVAANGAVANGAAANDAGANVTNCSKCLQQQRRLRKRNKLLNMRELAKKIRKEKKHQLERCMKGIRKERDDESNPFGGADRKSKREKEKEKNKSPKGDSILRSESDDNTNTSSSSTSNGFINEEMDHPNVSKRKSLRSRAKKKPSRCLSNFRNGNNHNGFMSSTSDSCSSNDTNSFLSSEEVDSFDSNREQRNGGDSYSSSTADSFISIYGYLIKNKQRRRRRKRGCPEPLAVDRLAVDRLEEDALAANRLARDSGRERNAPQQRSELGQEESGCMQGAEADGTQSAEAEAKSEAQTKAANEETEAPGGVVKKGKKRTCVNSRSDMNIYKKEKKKENKKKIFTHEYCLPSKTARNILNDEENYKMQEKNVDVEEIVDRMLEECEFWDNDKITPIQFKSVIYKYDFFLYVFFSCLHEDVWGLQGNVLYGRDYISNFVIKSETFKSKQIDANEEVITEEVYFKIRQLFIIQAPDYDCLNDNLCVNFRKGERASDSERGGGHEKGSGLERGSHHQQQTPEGTTADADKDKGDPGASRKKAKLENGSKLVNFALPSGVAAAEVIAAGTAAEAEAGTVAGVGPSGVEKETSAHNQEQHANAPGGDDGRAELCVVVTGRPHAEAPAQHVEGLEKREAAIPSSGNALNRTNVGGGVDAALEPASSRQAESPQGKKEGGNVEQSRQEKEEANVEQSRQEKEGGNVGQPCQEKEEANVGQPCEEKESAAQVGGTNGTPQVSGANGTPQVSGANGTSQASNANGTYGTPNTVDKLEETEEKRRLDGKKKIAECFNAVLRQKGSAKGSVKGSGQDGGKASGKGSAKDATPDGEAQMGAAPGGAQNKAGDECDFNLLTNSLNDIFSKEIVEFIKASQISFNINEVWKERNAQCKDKYKKAKRNIEKARNYSSSAHSGKKKKKPPVGSGVGGGMCGGASSGASSGVSSGLGVEGATEGVNGAEEAPPSVNEAMERSPAGVEKGEAVEKEAVKEEAVKEEAVKEEAVKEEAVKEEAVKEEAVKEEAVKEEAEKEEAEKEEAVEMPAEAPAAAAAEVPPAASAAPTASASTPPRPAHEGKKKKKHVKDVNLYSCPNCKGPFLMCPNCHGRYPRFCVNEDKIAMECEYCECEHCYFYSCIYCNFDFQKCLDMIKKNSLKEGILYKIGKHLHQFKARYYILFDNLLYYYDKQKNLKPRGFMFLEGCYVEVISKNDNVSKFGFSICHKGTKQVQRRDLYVNTHEEREEWLQALYSTTKQNTLYNLYELHEQLGQGKFSTVYRGINKQTNAEFAIKVIDKRSVSIYEKELLRSEISILRLLRHPNVIYLKEIINTKETLYISMELVKGGELYDFLLTETRLSEIHANKIVTQLIKTVAYLHRCGIIHRDIKPENILLTDKSRDAQIKLTDFGLSTLCAPNELLKEPCGTLAYVAPEVITLQGYNHKVDAWSIGIILFLLLSGKLPFPINKNTEMNIQKNYVLNFKDHIWKSISSSAKDLISKLLELNVEKRISANEALEHIWIKNPTAVINENSFIYKNEEINILNLQDVSVSTFNIPKYAPFHLVDEKTEEVESKNVFSFHKEDILYENNDSTDEPVIPLPYSGAPLKDSAAEKNPGPPLAKETSLEGGQKNPSGDAKGEAPVNEENPPNGDVNGEDPPGGAPNGDQREERTPCEGQQTGEGAPAEHTAAHTAEQGGGDRPPASPSPPPGDAHEKGENKK